MFNGLLFFIKFGWKSDKRYVVYNFLCQFISSVIPIVSVIIPKFMIDELVGKQRVWVLMMYIGGYTGYLFVSESISNWLSLHAFTLRTKLSADWGLFLHERLMDADFENLENPEFLDMKEKANKFLYGDWQGFSYIFDSALNVMGQFITLIGIISIIATLNFGMVILFIGLVLLSSYVEAWAKKRDMELSLESVKVERGWDYYGQLMEDFQYGKEIRINHLEEWLLHKEKAYADTAVEYYRKRNSFHIKSGFITSALTFVQQIIAYVYVAISVVTKSLTVGDFTLYIGTITTFAEAMRRVMRGFVEIRAYGMYYEAVESYMNIPRRMRDNKREPLQDIEHEICFENVSFCYQGQEEFALKNINLTICPGEKISIVGENGAGKTTLIKLLTRLYDPTEGRILIDGMDIRDIDYEEYMDLFSAVFQDYKLFSMSLYDNVKLAGQENRSMIETLLCKVGLSSRLQTLKDGVDTFIYKIFDESGFEPSGGEGQKIALARALYKNAPIVILDEPTAALDPRAEFELYQQFNELVDSKTALYISHRLSSARFCDKILVLKNGEIIESGTHDELIVLKNGVYRELYRMQAQFYQEQGE